MRLLLLFCTVFVVHAEIIAVWIEHTKLLEDTFYVAQVHVGFPLQQLKMEIKFGIDYIALPHDQDVRSVEFAVSPLNSSCGSEVFFFNSHAFRLPVVLKPLYAPKSLFRCRDCDGVLGLGFSSPMWRLWPRIGFLMSSIRMGEEDQHELFDEEAKHVIQLKCDPHNYNSLCTVPAVYNNLDRMMKIQFDPALHRAQLPRELFVQYTKNKNLYTTEKWEPIRFTLFDEVSGRSFSLELDEEDIITAGRDEKPVLLIEPHDRDNYTIVIGQSIWNDFIIMKDQPLSTLWLRKHDTYSHYSIFTLVSLLVLYVCVSRRMIVKAPVDFRQPWKQLFVEWLFEFLPIALSIALSVMPRTWAALLDYPSVLIATLITLGVAVAAHIISYGHLARSKISNSFEANLVRGCSWEVINGIGMWVGMLEGRHDSIKSLWIIVSQIYLLYTLVFWVVIFGNHNLLAWSQLFSRRVGLWGLISMFLLAGLIYQWYATTFVFVYPYVYTKTNLFRQFSIQMTIMIELSLLLVVLIIQHLYSRALLKIYTNNQNKSTKKTS